MRGLLAVGSAVALVESRFSLWASSAVGVAVAVFVDAGMLVANGVLASRVNLACIDSHDVEGVGVWRIRSIRGETVSLSPAWSTQLLLVTSDPDNSMPCGSSYLP